MQNNTEALRKPCSDCDGLTRGTRSSQEPHQYLVMSAAGAARGPVFLCLVCGTALMKEGEGVATRWKI
jgi:hypothetical protein